jgi:hypothetical protein
VASLRGSVVTVTKGDELRTVLVWAAGFQDVRVRSRLDRILKLMDLLFL